MGRSTYGEIAEKGEGGVMAAAPPGQGGDGRFELVVVVFLFTVPGTLTSDQPQPGLLFPDFPLCTYEEKINTKCGDRYCPQGPKGGSF